MHRSEAASEWIVTDSGGAAAVDARFAATLGEFVRACRPPREDVPLQTDDPSSRPDQGPGVYLLLRKRGNAPDYQLLMNGRVATPTGDPPEYVLPPFQLDATLQEEATGRRVPGPVIVGLFVEEEGLAPDRVLLQVCQRTFVGGVQVDLGSEGVAREVELSVIRPSDTGARCVAVGYPMALGAPPTVDIVDNAKAEDVQNADRQ